MLDARSSGLPIREPAVAAVGTDNSLGAAPATVSTSIWRRVRRDVLLLGSGSVGIVIAQLGFRAILIAALVPASYGRLSLILSIYNTIMIVGASGLPNGAARYIAASSPAADSAIVRAAVRAAAWPTALSAAIVAVASGILLDSPAAFLFGAIGLSSLVYSLLTTGILRGRGKILAATLLMPIAAFCEFGLLAAAWFFGRHVTPLSAYGIFCLGNVIGVSIAVFLIKRTAPPRKQIDKNAKPVDANTTHVPGARELLGFSAWLGLATAAVAAMPLFMRFAAVLDSYTVVAIVDIALVFLSIPQRVGTVIVSAVIPHVTRSIGKDDLELTLSRREHAVMVIPFVLAASLLAFTPVVGWLFDALGRPEYQKDVNYLALALLAGPARILYGIVQGVLAAHGEGRFMALSALAICGLASAAIVTACALGSTLVAFGIFVVACWAIYLNGLARVNGLTSRAQVSEAI